MAVVAVDGGDERARAREGESREGSRGRERVRERSEGAAWHHRGVEEEAGGGQGKQEVAEASRARATPRLCLLAEEDDRGEVEMGWAVLGQVSGRQVTSFSLSLFYFFSISVILFLI